MSRPTVAQEGAAIGLAVDMIRLGARLQVLQAETHLSYERLSSLYRDVRGHFAPKGMLPYSVDWYVSWQPNLHSSVFHSIYRDMNRDGAMTPLEAGIEAYKLYLEHIQSGLLPISESHGDAVLSFTRAWTLLRFIDNGLLCNVRCARCRGLFIAHANATEVDYVCGICRPPSRAGATLRRKTQVAS